MVSLNLTIMLSHPSVIQFKQRVVIVMLSHPSVIQFKHHVLSPNETYEVE
jgi:hypothetical protein